MSDASSCASQYAENATTSPLPIAVLALAACGAPQSPARPATPACAARADAVECTATNSGSDRTAICLEPYLVVRDTGALFTKRGCSPPIGPHESATFAIHVGALPRDVCGAELAGCVVRVFDGGAPTRHILAFVREVQDRAPHLTREHPSVRECENAVVGWRANPSFADDAFVRLDPDLVVRVCIDAPRSAFECAVRAPTPNAINACPRP